LTVLLEFVPVHTPHDQTNHIPALRIDRILDHHKDHHILDSDTSPCVDYNTACRCKVGTSDWHSKDVSNTGHYTEDVADDEAYA